MSVPLAMCPVFIIAWFATLCPCKAHAEISGPPVKDDREDGFVVQDSHTGNLTWVSGADMRHSNRAQALVHGVFLDSIASRGSGWLDVSTLREASDEGILFEALGFAEGFLTARRSFQMYVNTMSGAAPPEIQEFLQQHNAYMNAQAAKHGDSDPYWYAVKLNLARMKGFGRGLRRRLPDFDPLVLAEGHSLDPVNSWRDRLLSLPEDLYNVELLRFNMKEDTDEISRALAFASTASQGLRAIEAAATDKEGKRGHCSALIKVVGDRVLLGHASWDDFGDMLRIWKDIRFTHVRHPGIVNRRISMSSYPGYYASTDDWLVMPDTQLVVLETTNDAYDNARLARYVKPTSVNTPLRSVIASMVASTPKEWYAAFSRENSGAQNNQWMIFSADLWAKSRRLWQPTPVADVLWVLEQQPGLIEGHDMTELLIKQGYWSSYNVAQFKETSKIGQYWLNRDSVCVCEAQRGPLLDHAQLGVRSLGDLQALLTTNTWRSAPLSWNCPKCSIAARFDLRGENVSIGAELPKSSGSQHCGADSLFGAIDAKVIDDSMLRSGETLFVSGPPGNGEDVPPFSWDTAVLPPGKPVPLHYGHPSGPWQFPWFRYGGLERRDPSMAGDHALNGEVQQFEAAMSFMGMPAEDGTATSMFMVATVVIGFFVLAVGVARKKSVVEDARSTPFLL